MYPRKKGYFIVFEGIDGSGKGTMMHRASAYLFNHHKRFDHMILTREPTYSGVGRTIREMLKKSDSPKSDAKRLLSLYLEDRKEHLTKLILPSLSTGALILCDRYKYSTLAYQQTQGISLQQIVNLHKNMIAPDLVILLDVDPKTALLRIQSERGSTDKFEQLEFMTELRENYLRLKEVLPHENIVVVDANPSLDTVFMDVQTALDKLLSKSQ